MSVLFRKPNTARLLHIVVALQKSRLFTTLFLLLHFSTRGPVRSPLGGESSWSLVNYPRRSRLRLKWVAVEDVGTACRLK